MRKEDIKVSFDRIKPSESDKKRILDNIMKQSDKKKGFTFISPYNYKKAIPALALVVAIIVGSLAYYRITRKYNYVSPPGNSVADDAGSSGREDMVAPLINQFRIDDRHYILLYDDQRAEYGLPATINESDIGEKIADIANSPDKSLIGSEVYSYIPAGGEAVVAVKREDGYQLFKFFVFESYNNNQDEDAARYLALYGIDGADDIAKIQFIVYSEQSKLEGRTDIKREMTDRDEIERFYGFYSVLKNSSDRYFDKLFNFNDGLSKAQPGDMPTEGAAIAEDMPLVITDDVETGAASANGRTGAISGDTPVTSGAGTEPSHGMIDMGNTGSGAVEPSRGAALDALENMVTIRIYNRSGIYYETAYYVNIGFISRYEVSEEFAGFLSKYIR